MFNNEVRHHHQLRKYWDKMRGNRPYPSEADIDPDDLKKIWPSCFLVNIDAVTERVGYRYSYLGSELIAAYGEDTHNPDIVNNLVATDTSSMSDKFNEVVNSGKPVMVDSEFVNMKKLRIRYRTCMLPLGHPDGKVGYILGCMRWKAY